MFEIHCIEPSKEKHIRSFPVPTKDRPGCYYQCNRYSPEHLLPLHTRPVCVLVSWLVQRLLSGYVLLAGAGEALRR